MVKTILPALVDEIADAFCDPDGPRKYQEFSKRLIADLSNDSESMKYISALILSVRPIVLYIAVVTFLRLQDIDSSVEREVIKYIFPGSPSLQFDPAPVSPILFDIISHLDTPYEIMSKFVTREEFGRRVLQVLKNIDMTGDESGDAFFKEFHPEPIVDLHKGKEIKVTMDSLPMAGTNPDGRSYDEERDSNNPFFRLYCSDKKDVDLSVLDRFYEATGDVRIKNALDIVRDGGQWSEVERALGDRFQRRKIRESFERFLAGKKVRKHRAVAKNSPTLFTPTAYQDLKEPRIGKKKSWRFKESDSLTMRAKVKGGSGGKGRSRPSINQELIRTGKWRERVRRDQEDRAKFVGQ